MKKLLHLTLLLLMVQGSVSLKAQMRIGGNTAPNPNAILDLNEDETAIGSKGLLLPRVALVSATDFLPLSAHVRGMYVYNTATAKGVSPGVYYNDGTKWIRIMGDSDAGLTILNYLINNLTQEFVDSIMAHVSIASADNTVNVVGSGTSDIDLGVNIDVIADSLLNNEIFITNLIDSLVTNNYFTDSIMANVSITSDDNTVNIIGSGTSDIDLAVNMATVIDILINNSTFIQNLVTDQTFIDSITNLFAGEKFIDSLIHNLFLSETFMDSLIHNLFLSETFMDSLIHNLFLSETFMDSLIHNLFLSETFMDSIMHNLLINEMFMDSILNYITNNVTQELTDSIMANVKIKGDNGIIVEGSGTSDITVKLPEGDREGQILVWDNTLSTWGPAEPTVIKQATITVDNGTFDTKNLVFYGTTSTTTKPLKVISIEPVFSNVVKRREFLHTDATVQVVGGNTAEWTVSIDNRNFSLDNTFTLVSVIISYICEDLTPLADDTQGFIEIVGY
ncbi:MAG: hypothetical protein LBH22_02360 [Bacteroidales bacterium]|nr:hypothetical protein [Bacteroidales bacterium]